MNIAEYILSGLFAVTVILSFVIPVRIVKKILNCFTFPLMAASTISILYLFLPDALHNILITSIGFTILSIAVAFYNFREYKKFFPSLAIILYFVSFFPFINFLGTVFYLNHIPYFVTILSLLVYLTISVFLLILLKKQSPKINVKIFITYCISAILNFLTFLDLIYDTRLYSPFLFSGSLIILLNIIFTSLDYTKVFKIKNGAIITKICLITGYSLFSTGLYFMIAR